MKKLMLALAISFMASGSFAQKGNDYVTVKPDGKAYWVRGGQTIKLALPVPLKNGSFVYADGSVKSSEGEISKMGQGDKILMDGTLIPRRKRK